jgi:hypothetical protein
MEHFLLYPYYAELESHYVHYPAGITWHRLDSDLKVQRRAAAASSYQQGEGVGTPFSYYPIRNRAQIREHTHLRRLAHLDIYYPQHMASPPPPPLDAMEGDDDDDDGTTTTTMEVDT